MFWTSYLLAVLAIVLAWPVPIFLSRAQWPARSPFTAMLLWQAIALAGGLSMIGAMLVYGLEPVGDNLIAGLRALAGMVLFNAPTTALGFWHVFALSAAALLTAHLVFTLLLTYYNWTDPFPDAGEAAIVAGGSTPLMAWYLPDKYTGSTADLSAITSGADDAWITTQALAMKAFGHRVFLRLAPEMNMVFPASDMPSP